MQSRNYTIVFRLVQLATIGVFLGRAYQHLFWDAPFRSLLWDEAWMKYLVESISSYQWEDYITDMKMDDRIQGSIQAFGYFYLLAALLTIFIKKIPSAASFLQLILPIGSACLIFLAALYCKERFFSIGQFLEYSLQFSSPLFLYFLLKQKEISKKLLLWMKITIALTFTCHGLYAIGYYPIPGNFVEMTMNILGVSNENARLFLKVAGILDFIASILIFLPRKWAIPALMYMVFWGLATTIARIWAHFYIDFPWESLHQWSFEAIYRFPHFLIPLCAIFIIKNKHRISRIPNSNDLYSA